MWLLVGLGVIEGVSVNAPAVVLPTKMSLPLAMAMKPPPSSSPRSSVTLSASAVSVEPAVFWRRLLRSVDSYADLEQPLIGAVEQLLDFVAPPPGP